MFKNKNGSWYFKVKKIKYDLKFFLFKRTKQIGFFKSFEEIKFLQRIQISENQLSTSYAPKCINKTFLYQEVLLNNIIAYKIQTARILLNTNAVYTPIDKTMYHEMWHDKEDVLYLDYSSKNIFRHNTNQVRFSHKLANEILDKGIFLGCTFVSNYYHFLLELVARVAYLKQIPNAKNYPILISDKVLKFESFKSIINIFFTGYQVQYLDDSFIYEIKEVWYLTSPNSNLPNIKYGTKFEIRHTKLRLESVQYLRKKCFDYVFNLPKDSNTYNKIFIKRKSNVRGYNQDEIVNCATKYGFNSVYFEELSFVEQVRIMQHADYVIGPTGAAWTNLVFAKEGAKGLIWMGSNWGNVSMFSTLAKMVNFDLNYIIYDSLSVDYHEEFELDLCEFEDNLKQVLTQ
jgi:capsular polysaccharide biosynthesis protein